MFESTPFLGNRAVIHRSTDEIADARLVALVNEARSHDERMAIGRSATARVRFTRRRRDARRAGPSSGAGRLRRWASLRS